MASGGRRATSGESAALDDGDFSYSLLNALSLATCSYMPNSSVVLTPDLAFLDSKFANIIYFVDPKSAGAFWTIRQFEILSLGYMQALETFIVKNFAENGEFGLPPGRDTDGLLATEDELNRQVAGDFTFALDAQRLRLYAVARRERAVAVTCAHDLLFR